MSAENITQSLLASSHQTNWRGVSLEHYLYPAYETPEHTLEDHHICLYVGTPLTYEQVIKGKLRSEAMPLSEGVSFRAG